MTRYEVGDGETRRFWEIELEGSKILTRWGKAGQKEQKTTRRFASQAHARKEQEKLVAEKLKKGYALAKGTKSVAAAKPRTKASKTRAPTKKKRTTSQRTQTALPHVELAPAPAPAPAALPGEVVFEGKLGSYAKADALVLERLGQASRDESDRSLKTLGFLPVGDLAPAKLSGMLVRGYGLELGDTYGALILPGLPGERAFQFFSIFDEGACLVTTTSPQAFASKGPKVVLFSHPEHAKDVGSLYTVHVREVLHLMHSAGAPRRALANLGSFVPALDEVFSSLGLAAS